MRQTVRGRAVALPPQSTGADGRRIAQGGYVETPERGRIALGKTCRENGKSRDIIEEDSRFRTERRPHVEMPWPVGASACVESFDGGDGRADVAEGVG